MLVFALIALGALGLDLLTKRLVFDLLLSPERPEIEVLGSVMSFTRATNTGGPFGAFGDYGGVFFVMALAFIAGLVAYRLITGGQGRYMDACLGMLLGGALGNWIDRIAFGHVRDFINFHFWPVFNVADIAITVGVIMLMGYIIFDGGGPGPGAREPDAPAEPADPEAGT